MKIIRISIVFLACSGWVLAVFSIVNALLNTSNAQMFSSRLVDAAILLLGGVVLLYFANLMEKKYDG